MQQLGGLLGTQLHPAKKSFSAIHSLNMEATKTPLIALTNDM